MSHFTVMVVGNDIEKQLQPYHEYECTGTKDEYVVFVDETEEMTNEFNNDTRTMLVNFDGEVKCQFDNEFYRDPSPEEKGKVGMGCGCGNGLSWNSKNWGDGLGYRPKVHFIPEDHMKIEVPFKKIFATVEEYCRDWHSYDDENFRDGKIGRMTNPNSKWDWYQVGGRWRGSLHLKKTSPNLLFHDAENLGFTESEIMNFIKLKDDNPEKFADVLSKYNGKSGQLEKFIDDISKSMKEPGFPEHLLSEKGWSSPDAEKGQADQALKKYVDIDAMEKPLRETASKNWDGWHSGIKDLEDGNEEKKKWIMDNLGWMTSNFDIKRITDMSRDEYITCKSAWGPYAMVWGGAWYSKGEMGWFGMSSSEENDWKGQFRELWKDIPDDSVITMVDCHI